MTFLDDTAPSVKYTGEWTQVPSTTAFEDTLHLTTQESAEVTVSFQGSSIVCYNIIFSRANGGLEHLLGIIRALC